MVREARREWNYREQKWETEQGESQEGELDAKNEFRATLNLSKDHSDLQDTDWKRFEDLRYAAYVTDASSKRTQEAPLRRAHLSRRDPSLCAEYWRSAADWPSACALPFKLSRGRNARRR